MTKKANTNNDSGLKKIVSEILSNAKFHNAVIDREVHINFSGDTDDNGELSSDIEIDVVVSFKDGTKKGLILFECRNSNKIRDVKRTYRDRNQLINDHFKETSYLKVVSSKDGNIKDDHFKDVDEVGAGFCYGKEVSLGALDNAKKEGKKYKFVVWGFSALKYYKQISTTLKGWTKYELLKEFSMNFEKKATEVLDAIRIKQKGQKEMYLARIHPGQLLKIAYVVRRTSEKSLAYQRMLNKHRIEDIARFIESSEPHTLLPNNLIVVFDGDTKIQDKIKYDKDKKELTIPTEYCSAWIIDGQHRAYGFIDTKYDSLGDNAEHFDLPIVIFKKLDEISQTQTFIDINYNQKKIKSDLLCDLATVTKDLKNQLTWVSLLGMELNRSPKSPLQGKLKISEFDIGSLSLSSFVKYGLLETLLGYKSRQKTYTGRLFTYAPFNSDQKFTSQTNSQAFKKQLGFLESFLVAVKKFTENTQNKDQDPWTNTNEYSLLRPTGINALLLVLAKMLELSNGTRPDFDNILKPLKNVNFERTYVASMGTGWQGFRNFANEIMTKINKGKPASSKLSLYGEKDKV